MGHLSNILFRNLIDDALEQDCMAKVLKKETKHINNLCNKIRECGNQLMHATFKP